MKDSFSISSSIELSGIISAMIRLVTPDEIECIYTEDKNKSSGYYLNLKSRCELPHGELVNSICDWILNNYEKKLMYEIFDECFEEFLISDKEQIINRADSKLSSIDTFYYKALVRKKLSEYLTTADSINIDGFVRFRMREYRERLEYFMYEAIEEYMAEKEYEAFVELLTEYINIQPPVIDFLHIKAEQDGSFSLYDFAQNNISVSCESRSGDAAIDSLLSEEDKLISILLTLTPRRIIWHNPENASNSKLIKTLKSVFGQRFSVCPGCDICSTDKNESD